MKTLRQKKGSAVFSPCDRSLNNTQSSNQLDVLLGPCSASYWRQTAWSASGESGRRRGALHTIRWAAVVLHRYGQGTDARLRNGVVTVGVLAAQELLLEVRDLPLLVIDDALELHDVRADWVARWADGQLGDHGHFREWS